MTEDNSDAQNNTEPTEFSSQEIQEILDEASGDCTPLLRFTITSGLRPSALRDIHQDRI